MIEVQKALAALDAPAKTLLDLHDRLSLSLGLPVSLEGYTLDGRFVRQTGILIKATYIGKNRNSKADVAIRFSGDDPQRDSTSASLEMRFQVLLDGQWKVLHEPPQEELREEE